MGNLKLYTVILPKKGKVLFIEGVMIKVTPDTVVLQEEKTEDQNRGY